MRAAPVRESIDAQADAIVRALAFAGLAANPRDVGYALVLLFALGIELMAAFGASWCGVQLPRRAPAETAPEPQDGRNARAGEAAPDVAAPAAAPQVEPLAAFVADLVKSDRTTAFKVLFAAYEARCKAAGEVPKSKRALGLALAARFEKTNLNGGEVHYGAQLRKRLAVVAA